MNLPKTAAQAQSWHQSIRMQRRSSSCLSHSYGPWPKGQVGQAAALFDCLVCLSERKIMTDKNFEDDSGVEKEHAAHFQFMSELYERDQREAQAQMDRIVNPQNYDENGNKIYVPDWWEGNAREYKDWERSNDRD